MKTLPFARRGLHRRPANGTGADFRVSRHGKRGQGKPCPYCEITKERYIFAKTLPFACRGLHRRPANGAGEYWGGCSCGKCGRSQTLPLLRNTEIAFIITHAPRGPLSGWGSAPPEKPLHRTQRKKRPANETVRRSYHLVHHRGLEPRAH